MEAIRKSLQLMTVVVLIAALFSAVPQARATTPGTITVDTVTDTLSDGHCSLPEALNLVDGVSGSDACTRVGSTSIDTINFSIGSGARTITLASQLDVTSPVFIDGTSQPGFDTTTRIPLINVTGSLDRLMRFHLGSSASTVRALELTNTLTASPAEEALWIDSDGVTIAGNYINTDGTASSGGSSSFVIGVFLTGSSATIGGPTAADRNLFGGELGVRVDNGSNNVIQGNYFGVTAAGNTMLTGLPVSDAAISFCEYGCSTGSLYNTIRDNVITGYVYGIYLQYPTSSNTIAHNIFGLGADGSTLLAYMAFGIYLDGSSSNTIGGTTAADRNVISNNSINIRLVDLSVSERSSGNTIEGNYIGTAANGLSRVIDHYCGGCGLYPAFNGIDVAGGNANLIGGTIAGSGNLISGNVTGIHVTSAATATVIRGNLIGTDATGTAAIPQYNGIYLDTGASADIGDAVTPGNNVIAGSTDQAGIYVAGSSGTTIYGNRLGLAATGTTPLPNGIGIHLVNASATIAQNWIADSSVDGLLIDSSSTVPSGSSQNCITGNASGVVSLNTGAMASFKSNWWGDVSGPGGVGPGTGDTVSNYVDYSAYLTALPTTCPGTIVDVSVGGTAQGTYPVYESYGIRKGYASLNNGPVQVQSEGGIVSIASERFIYATGSGSDHRSGTATSYSEMMGFPDSQLTTSYWFPWYNNVNMWSQLRFGNPSPSLSTTVSVYLGTTLLGSYPLGPAASLRVDYAGVNGGPLRIESSGGVPIIGAERVIYSDGNGTVQNGNHTSYYELMGFPGNQLATEYWIPWYNNVNMWSQLRLANPDTSLSTTVSVYLGTTLLGSYPLGPSSGTRVDYPGVNGGPLRIASSGGVNIIAAERVIYSEGGVHSGTQTSYSELMAVPTANLDSAYWFPSYSYPDVGTWSQLRVGNPSSSLTTTVMVGLAGAVMGTYSLGPRASIRLDYLGKDSGPLEVISADALPIIAAMRVIQSVSGTQTSYSEITGYPDSQLTTSYWFPWYNNLNFDTQLRMAVP